MRNRPPKIICLVGSLALAGNGMLCAQTDTNAVVPNASKAAVEVSLPAAMNANAGLPPKPRPATLISADRGEFDMAGRQVTYHGHVRVDDPEMKLTSEWLITDLPQAGGHVNHIVAETNVVIDFVDDKGQTNHATCAKTVYNYEVKDGTTNDMVTLSGDAKVENADFVMTGEPITLNLETRKITAGNPVVTPSRSFINANGGKISPPATNLPVAAPR